MLVRQESGFPNFGVRGKLRNVQELHAWFTWVLSEGLFAVSSFGLDWFLEARCFNWIWSFGQQPGRRICGLRIFAFKGFRRRVSFDGPILNKSQPSQEKLF